MSEDMSRDEVLSEFVTITGVDSERARFYLDSSAWHLDLALASFYETDGDAGLGIGVRRSDSVEIIDNDNDHVNDDIEEIEELPSPPTPKPASTNSKEKSKSKSLQNSRFATLASINKDESSDEEEGQAFYAGGPQSGQQVLGPGRKKKDFVSDMFKSVREHGAEVVEPSRSGSQSSSSFFGGTGYRLGQSANDTEVVSVPSARSNSNSEVTLKFWKQGFSIDDGPLREFADPANKEFLDHVRSGEVPDELLQQFKGGEVNLNMEDHRHEEFVMSRSKAKAFVGKGFMLGSPSPAAVGTTNTSDEKDRHANEKAAQDKVKVDESAPTTTLMIRFPDRTSVRARFNHTHTIADVRQFVAVARPQFNQQPFILSMTYPNKELDNYPQTIAEAGVLNSALVARLL